MLFLHAFSLSCSIDDVQLRLGTMMGKLSRERRLSDRNRRLAEAFHVTHWRGVWSWQAAIEFQFLFSRSAPRINHRETLVACTTKTQRSSSSKKKQQNRVRPWARSHKTKASKQISEDQCDFGVRRVSLSSARWKWFRVGRLRCLCEFSCNYETLRWSDGALRRAKLALVRLKINTSPLYICTKREWQSEVNKTDQTKRHI